MIRMGNVPTQFLHKRTSGFTIVELLIVVVVIAVLAAITIVAYNGIQNRAKNAATQASVSQAERKLAVYLVDNGDTLPDDMSAFGLTSTAGTTYDYEYNNASNLRSYCLSSTSNNSSSAKTTASGNILPGRCVRNLVPNPSIETGIAGTGAVYGQGGVATSGRVTSAGQDGANLFRITWNTAPSSVTTAGLWSYANSNLGLVAGGKQFTASGYIKNSWAGGIFSLNLVAYSSTNTVLGETYGPNVTVPSNTWTRTFATWTAPASTDYFVLRIRQSGGTFPSATSTMDSDAFMLTQGSNLYNYYDGSKDGWSWVGTPHASASFGPAQ